MRRILPLLGVVAGQMLAQNPSAPPSGSLFTPDRGFRPYGSYAITDVESINESSGNLNLRIPTASLPPGRNGFSVGVDLVYNSNVMDVRTGYQSTVTPANVDPQNVYAFQKSLAGGWQYSFAYYLEQESRGSCSTPSPDAPYLYRVSLVTPDGARHLLRMAGQSDYESNGFYPYSALGTSSPPCGPSQNLTGPITYYTTDGTFVRVVVEDGSAGEGRKWTASFPDGRRVTGINLSGGGISPPSVSQANRICDRNGNCVRIKNTLTAGNSPKTEIIDDLGRRVTINYGLPANVSTCSQPQGVTNTCPNSSSDVITRDGVGGPLSWTVNWKDISFATNYLCAGTQLAPTDAGGTCYVDGSHRVIDTIVLPAGGGLLKYKFQYADDSALAGQRGLGEILSMELPSGKGQEASARVDYRWSRMKAGTGLASNYEAGRYPVGNPIQSKMISNLEEFDTTVRATEGWTYFFGLDYATITGPNGVAGGVRSVYFYPRQTNDALKTWRDGLVWKTVSPEGETIERVWSRNKPPVASYRSAGSNFTAAQVEAADEKNPFVQFEYRTLPGGGIIPKRFDYDKNGNVVKTTEYEFGLGSIPRSGADPVALPLDTPTAVARITENTYAFPTLSAAADPATEGPEAYWQPTARSLRTAVTKSKVHKGGATAARSEFTYDSAAQTGNVTVEAHWDNKRICNGNADAPLDAACNASVITRTFDAYGQVLTETSPNGNRVKWTYEACDASGDADALFGYPGGKYYASKFTQADNDPAVLRSWSITQDCPTGAQLSLLDVQNVLTTQWQYDLFGRVKKQTEPGTRVTDVIYDDLNRTVRVEKPIDGTQKFAAMYHFNQLGQLWMKRETDDDGVVLSASTGGGIKTQMRERIYGNRRYVLESNPYRADLTSAAADQEKTIGWTVKEFDRDGRLKNVMSYAGKALPPQWGGNNTAMGTVSHVYSGATTTVTDQDGKARSATTDALGRLVTAYDGIATAAYEYDVLDNLTKVTMTDPATYGSSVTQVRDFEYDSLKRLTKATNPESGTMEYQYDAGGNVKWRKDARGVETCFGVYSGSTCVAGYDALNRLTAKNYKIPAPPPTPTGLEARATPGVTYCFDGKIYSGGACVAGGASYAKGRMTGFGSQPASGHAAMNWLQFDELGRVTKSQQVVAGQALGAMEYGYNQGDVMTQVKYPSGRVVAYGVTSGNRVSSAASGSTTYANNVSYAAHGAMAGLTAGPQGTTVKAYGQTWEYNHRLQMGKTVVAGTSYLELEYDYGTANNNGNVRGQKIKTAPGANFQYSQQYGYDNAQRLTSFTEGVNTQGYGYDHFGNLWQTGASGVPALGPNGPSWYRNGTSAVTNRFWNGVYDGAGNQAEADGRKLGYDAENRLVEVKDAAGAVLGAYEYDGEGRRVRKTVGTTEVTVFAYDAGGQLMAEYGGVAAAGTQYLVADHLGSTRLVVKADGTCVQRVDYAPYGGEMARGDGCYGGAAAVPQRFTGQLRDGESGLDYFGARYLASGLGRFSTTDPGPPRPPDPQSWNRFSYVRNNPLRRVDPDGLYDRDVHFDLTFVLGQAAGLSRAIAYQVAASNQDVDENPNTSPLTYPYADSRSVEARRLWHFPSPGRLGQLAAGVAADTTASALGQYLHVYQDSFSHAGYEPFWGHVFQDHAPDLTHLRPELAYEMAKGTYQNLRASTGSLGLVHAAVPWSRIAPLILRYLKSSSVTTKYELLHAVEEAIEAYREEERVIRKLEKSMEEQRWQRIQSGDKR